MFGGEQNPFMHSAESKRPNVLWSIIQAIVVALAINLTIYFLFIMPSQVDGVSMVPTLLDKELLFANKIPTWLGNTDFGKQNNLDYQRGQIIVFEYNDIYLVKRIIGIAGDKVKIESGNVFVNGFQLSEPYLSENVKTYYPYAQYASHLEGEEFTVPTDSYFVLGDNRPASKDSRYSDVGFITRGKLKGVIFLRFWPLNKFSILSKADY